MTHPQDRVRWLTDLVRLEIMLWDRMDGRLRERHDLPLAHFETLSMIADSGGAGLRVGDLAQRLRITVGGTSKLVDRIETTGLIRRAPDPADRRASRLVLTPAGQRALAAATHTYAADLGATLDPVLTAAEQQHLHSLVQRLLAAAGSPDTPDIADTGP